MILMFLGPRSTVGIDSPPGEELLRGTDINLVIPGQLFLIRSTFRRLPCVYWQRPLIANVTLKSVVENLAVISRLDDYGPELIGGGCVRLFGIVVRISGRQNSEMGWSRQNLMPFDATANGESVFF